MSFSTVFNWWQRTSDESALIDASKLENIEELRRALAAGDIDFFRPVGVDSESLLKKILEHSVKDYPEQAAVRVEMIFAAVPVEYHHSVVRYIVDALTFPGTQRYYRDRGTDWKASILGKLNRDRVIAELYEQRLYITSEIHRSRREGLRQDPDELKTLQKEVTELIVRSLKRPVVVTDVSPSTIVDTETRERSPSRIIALENPDGSMALAMRETLVAIHRVPETEGAIEIEPVT